MKFYKIFIIFLLLISSKISFSQTLDDKDQSINDIEYDSSTSSKVENSKKPKITLVHNVQNKILQYKDTVTNWLDVLHESLGDNIYKSAVWFDNFFGDEIVEDELYLGSYINVKVVLDWDEIDKWSYNTRIHADVELPRVTKKLKLIFDDEKKENIDDVNIESTHDTEITKEKFKLRYNVFKKTKKKLHFDVGSLYIKGRFRYIIELHNNYYIRFSETVFLDEDDGAGSKLKLDFDRQINKTLMRLGFLHNYYEETDLSIWGAGLSYYNALSNTSAIACAFSLSGSNTSDHDVDTYRFAIRFRNSFYRSWVFYEIEPAISWPYNSIGSREPIYACMFKVEYICEKNNIPGK